MTITYALWHNSHILSATNKATSSDEILEVIAELNKLGKGFTFSIREVQVNN